VADVNRTIGIGQRRSNQRSLEYFTHTFELRGKILSAKIRFILVKISGKY
jgi:hypothetical protein